MAEFDRIKSRDVLEVFIHFLNSKKYGKPLRECLLLFNGDRPNAVEVDEDNLLNHIKTVDYFSHVTRLINKYLHDKTAYEKINPYNRYIKDLVSLYMMLKSEMSKEKEAGSKITTKTSSDISDVLEQDVTKNLFSSTQQGQDEKIKRGKDLNLVFRRYDCKTFIGRQTRLKQLSCALKKHRAYVVVTGERGIGKTTLVQKYLADSTDVFDNYLWVTVIDSLHTSLLHVVSTTPCINFKLSGNDNDDFILMLQALNEIPGKNLLIIDNANNSNQITSFIALCESALPQWSVLFTTHSKPIGISCIELNALNKKDAFEMFKAIYNHDRVPVHIRMETNNFFKTNKCQIVNMLNKIERHTLLIELIAKVDIEDEMLTIKEISKIINGFEDLKCDLLNSVVICPQTTDPAYSILGENEKTLYNYVKAIFEKDLHKLNKVQKRILGYFALLPSDFIPVEHAVLLFGIDVNKLHRLFAELNGWLQNNTDTHAYKMNELYQYAIKAIFSPTLADIKELIVKIDKEINFIEEKNTDLKLLQTLKFYKQYITTHF